MAETSRRAGVLRHPTPNAAEATDARTSTRMMEVFSLKVQWWGMLRNKGLIGSTLCEDSVFLSLDSPAEDRESITLHDDIPHRVDRIAEVRGGAGVAHPPAVELRGRMTGPTIPFESMAILASILVTSL